jgi:hypothetical protein
MEKSLAHTVVYAILMPAGLFAGKGEIAKHLLETGNRKPPVLSEL